MNSKVATAVRMVSYFTTSGRVSLTIPDVSDSRFISRVCDHECSNPNCFIAAVTESRSVWLDRFKERPTTALFTESTLIETEICCSTNELIITRWKGNYANLHVHVCRQVPESMLLISIEVRTEGNKHICFKLLRFNLKFGDGIRVIFNAFYEIMRL